MKTLQLERPLVCFDIESTGTDPVKDRIVEIAFVKTMPDGEQHNLVFFINPGRPIPKEASDVHGITDDKVADCPRFEQVGKEIYDFIIGCDYLGYNLINFDLPMLDEHLQMFCNLTLPEGMVIDAGNIFKKKEERTLTAAVKFYCGKDHTDAHGALPDVIATCNVLQAQLERYDDLPSDVSQLATYSQYKPLVDWAGKFGFDEDGDYIYNIGSNRGTKVKLDTGMCSWMLSRDFPSNTKMWCRRLIEMYGY